MPISLPEKIDRYLFRTVDGRMTTEAETTFAAAQAIVANGRNLDDPVLLTRAVRVLVMYGHYAKWPRQVIFPAIGMLQGCFDRQLYRGRGIRPQIAGLMFRLVHARLEAEATKRWGTSSPGWNDYHMAYWFMTGDKASARELHRRATGDYCKDLVSGKGPCQNCRLLKAGAAYMIESVRRQYSDFDEAMTKLETRSERPVVPEDPTEGPPAGAAA